VNTHLKRDFRELSNDTVCNPQANQVFGDAGTAESLKNIAICMREAYLNHVIKASSIRITNVHKMKCGKINA